MTILLPALTAAFAAFCVWLTVRIINRRERWAKWTLAASLLLPVLYVASFGPWCWAMSRWGPIDEENMSCSIYLPLVRMWWDHPTDVLGESLRWYGRLFADPTVDPAIVDATGKMILGNSP